MLTHAHTCPPARWPTCTHVFAHVHTHSHMCTHIRTCSHMFTPAQTSSHMFTHVHTCLHMFTHAPHGNALPVLALTGFRKSSFSVCFTMVFEGFAPKPFCQFSKIAKTLGPFNKNSTSKFAHSCTQPQVGQHAPKWPQGGPQAAVQKCRKR